MKLAGFRRSLTNPHNWKGKTSTGQRSTPARTPEGFFSPAVRRRRGNFTYVCLEFDSFHFVERNLILCPIIELRRTGRLVSGDLLSVFEGATVLQISGNPGRSECMAAGGVGKGRCFGPPF